MRHHNFTPSFFSAPSVCPNPPLSAPNLRAPQRYQRLSAIFFPASPKVASNLPVILAATSNPAGETSPDINNSSLTSLESALIRFAPVTPVESALTKSLSRNPFRIRTYEKTTRGTHIMLTSVQAALSGRTVEAVLLGRPDVLPDLHIGSHRQVRSAYSPLVTRHSLSAVLKSLACLLRRSTKKSGISTLYAKILPSPPSFILTGTSSTKALPRRLSPVFAKTGARGAAPISPSPSWTIPSPPRTARSRLSTPTRGCSSTRSKRIAARAVCGSSI